MRLRYLGGCPLIVSMIFESVYEYECRKHFIYEQFIKRKERDTQHTGIRKSEF